jgi:hypothetical protein
MATPPDFTAGQILTAAQMNAVGMWLISDTTITTQSSVSFDGVFTADYRNYLLILRYQTTNDVSLEYQNRASASNATSNYNRQQLVVDSTSVAGARVTAQSSYGVGQSSVGVISFIETYISGPQLSEATLFATTAARNYGSAYTNAGMNFFQGNHSTATAYDGFRLFVSAGTFTGTATIYGLNK